MRIGSTILFKDGLTFQSYGWEFLRPLGNLQNAVNHLDKYLIDEITILRPVRGKDEKTKFIKDLAVLKNLKSTTPISFGGGIRNLDQLYMISGLPFERIIFSSALFQKKSNLLEEANKLFGRQAIVGLIPFKYQPNLKFFNSNLNRFVSDIKLNHIQYCDEIILYDCQNEGKSFGFNLNIIKDLDLDHDNFILSGGVSNLLSSFKNNAKNPNAISIENSILHKEYSKVNYFERM